jgi:hypothetical protein
MINWLETAISDALEWVDDRLPMVWTILTEVFPVAVVAAMAVAGVWSTRQVIIRYRGRSPRVQITPFTWATATGEDQEALWITSLFREQLNELKLDSLDAIPDRAPGAPLVQIVEGVGQGVAHGLDVGRAIARLWRAAFPDSAYEVWATLRPLDSGSGGEIAVQLVDRAHGNRTLASVISRDADWENSARQAAMAVAGALYPRVANRHTGPWTQWDKAVPPRLIGLYHGALEHESANRLELALGAFREALAMDPLNPNLRIKIAMLEERLELHLDAWFTYRAIVDEDSRKLWKGPDRRVRLLALYRLAIHLSNREVADQWVEPDRRKQKDRVVDEHDHALTKLRDELILALECDPLLGVDAGDHHPRIAKGQPAGLMAALLASRQQDGTRNPDLLHPFKCASEPSEERIRRIHEVLQIVSLRRLEELYAWQRVGPPVRGRKLGERWIHRRPLVRHLGRAPEFSRMAVRTSMRLVRIRIAASVHVAAKELEGTERLRIRKAVRKERGKLTRRWPFPRTGAGQSIARFFRPRLRWIDRRSDAWQLHYNAACAVGSTLLPKSPWLSEPLKRKFARRAVVELEEYAHRAGSERVAGQTDWLVFQDPDLAGLVKTAEFRVWAVPHLAFEVPKERPARDVEVRRYTALIVHRGALAFAKSWRDRAREGSVPITMAIDWWRREKEIWEQISTACRQRRSWRHRLTMLKEMERWSAGNGAVAVDLAHEHRDRSASRKMVPHELFEQLVMRIQGGEKLPSGSDEALSVQSWVNARVDDVEAAHNENPRGYVSSPGAGLYGAEREAAIAAAQIWTRLAAIMELGLRRELEGRQYKGEDEFAVAWKACLEDFAKEVPS